MAGWFPCRMGAAREDAPAHRAMRLLIVGGNRFLGAELVTQAVHLGHEVTVLSLGKPSSRVARWLKANREASLAGTFDRLTFDAVIDNIAFRARHVLSLAEALRDKAQRYVLTSSVDIYCNHTAKYCDELQDERLHPFLHSRAIPQWEAYLRGKRACEIALRNSPHFEKVVVRPAVVVGARDNFMWPAGSRVSRSLFFPLRIADGGPILLRHTDTRLHQTAYVGDVARALLVAATHPHAAGQVFNVVGDEVWTNERLVYSLAASVGRRTDVVRVSDSQLEAAGLHHYQTPYSRSHMHSWSLFSNRRLKKLGWRSTPAEQWGQALFCFPGTLLKDIAEQREKERGLGRRITNRTSVRLTSGLPGQFRSGVQALSPVGIGTHRGSASRPEDRAYFAAITHAVRNGINVIDTAINYRGMRSERVVGQAVRRLVADGIDRSSLCVVTKGGFIPSSLLACGILTEQEIQRKHSIAAEYIALSLQQSLQNTGLESIDLYLLHNPEDSLEVLGETRFYESMVKTFAMLEQRVRQGRIGKYGVATWDGLRTPVGHPRYLDLNRVLRCAELANGGSSNFGVIEIPLNRCARGAAMVLSQPLGSRLVSALELAGARGLLVLTSRSLSSGTGDIGASLRFVWCHPEVSCALAGMRRLEHVDEAIAVMRGECGEARVPFRRAPASSTAPSKERTCSPRENPWETPSRPFLRRAF